MSYEMVIGLEVHVELSTASKVFCSCTTEFGGEPNTHCCPICTGMPGTLPVLNKNVLLYALKAGLALNCTINKLNKFDRKNYFYPDLPKAYQISQLYLPFARDGFVDIGSKKIRIHEIHMEEDAGKLVHSEETGETFIDYNRCGVPLIEIVTEPDFRSAKDVTEFLGKIKSMFEYLGISDCKMQEGSMRADVNLSIREEGSTNLGTRTEMKNLNSFKAIERAISFEFARQKKLIEQGFNVVQETRRWDDGKGQGYSMRSKENSADYRYFPEPDIPPVLLREEFLKELSNGLPEFADAKAERYVSDYRLTEADAKIIASNKYLAALFEETVALTNNPKEVRYWLLGQIMYFMNEKNIEAENIKLAPSKFAEFVNIASSDRINRQTAKIIFEELFFSCGDFNIESFIKEKGLEQVDDTEAIRSAVISILNENPAAVSQFKRGETKVQGFFVGQVMKAMRGKAKPDIVNKILAEELSKL